VRFEVARKIVERAADHGIPRDDVIVDPLVMPIGAMATAGQQVFRLVRRLREELGVNTTCGASNVSFGMPDRERINAAFLPMAIASGLTSAITNPLAAEVKAAIMAADVLMGNDQDASRWIKAHREAAQPERAAPSPAMPVGASRGGNPTPLSVIEGGSSDVSPGARPAGSRPRINRRALAAAAAMRDASGGPKR
jgi:5-methyltetrahydrofolate--homocysteine methyltransferase